MSTFRNRAELKEFVARPRDEQIGLLIKAAQLRISTVGIDAAFRDAIAHAWDFGALSAVGFALGENTNPFTQPETAATTEPLQ